MKKPRNEHTSPPVARDASAIMNFEPEAFIDADTKLEVATVPMTFIRRAKRVAASALTQARDRAQSEKRLKRVRNGDLSWADVDAAIAQEHARNLRDGKPKRARKPALESKRNRQPGKSSRQATNASRVAPRGQKTFPTGSSAKYGNPRKPAAKRRRR